MKSAQYITMEEMVCKNVLKILRMTQKYLKLYLYFIKRNFVCGKQIKISYKAQMWERNCGIHTQLLKVDFEIKINVKN